MEQFLGVLTHEECDQIMELHRRRTALAEMSNTLADRGLGDNNDIYKRLVNDLGVALSEQHKWWMGVSNKYNWPSPRDARWSVDFESRRVSLVFRDLKRG